MTLETERKIAVRQIAMIMTRAARVTVWMIGTVLVTTAVMADDGGLFNGAVTTNSVCVVGEGLENLSKCPGVLLGGCCGSTVELSSPTEYDCGPDFVVCQPTSIKLTCNSAFPKPVCLLPADRANLLPPALTPAPAPAHFHRAAAAPAPAPAYLGIEAPAYFLLEAPGVNP